uniref:Peptidase S28 n=2 Tax=Bursaphelenchus xylophilus TaxID=6326 RepID=A0A1I7S994_BURXY
MERIFLLLILLTSVKATFSWPIPDESPLGNDTIGTYIWARVDNFDNENNQTYKQYYKTLFEGNSELRILYVGGESENEVKPPSELLLAADSKYKKLLEELHGEFDATVYSLEHRYYDHSYPVHFPEKAEDFKYLTSQQALADVANFINVQNSLNEGKWITIGGSYPGMLSLWFRQLYPKLTVGAIGSSSPVNAVVNFTSFFLVSQNGYKRRHPECHEKLKLAFDEFRGILEKKTDLSILDQLYPNLTSVFDYNTAYGLNNIAYQVVSDAYTQIQTNIDGICSTYNVSTEEPLVELAANFKQTADHIQDKHWGSWLWQVCNEFGFFYSPSHEEFQAKGTYDIKEVFQK